MNDQTTDYTPDELAQLPQTDMVFDQPALDFDAHVWQQSGYTLEDRCGGGCLSQGIPIKSGTMLIKENGKYKLVDEMTRR